MPIKLTEKDFEQTIVKAIDSLPEGILRLMESGNLSISYANEPTEDQRADLKNKDGDILGMHTGAPKQSSLGPIGSWPSFIYIFQLAVEKRCDTVEQVQDFVRGILLHEIGHFFGMTEAQLTEIGQLSSVGEKSNGTTN